MSNLSKDRKLSFSLNFHQRQKVGAAAHCLYVKYMSSGEVRRSLLLPLLSNEENTWMSSFKIFLRSSAPDRNQCIFGLSGILVPLLCIFTFCCLSILVWNWFVVPHLWNDDQNKGGSLRGRRDGIHFCHCQHHPISCVTLCIPDT